MPETIRSRSLSSSSSCVGNGDELAVDAAQRGPSRSAPGTACGETSRRGAGADHRQHVGVVLPVAGQDEALNLHFVVIPGGEQRADGPVDQPRGEHFLDGGPAFALDEAAGELAGRGGPLAIVAGQREEVDARAAAGRSAAATSTTVSPYCTRQLPAACLASAGFDREDAIADLFFYTILSMFCFLP